MAFYDYHAYEAKLTQRAINAYEDWKDSPERYEWSASTKKDQGCRWLHAKRLPCPCACCGQQDCTTCKVTAGESVRRGSCATHGAQW